MPIGNGDVAASVWVEQNTGDLRMLLAKSDVFDETGQPVKTGVIRLAFDPPLWKSGSAQALHESPTTSNTTSSPPLDEHTQVFVQTLDLATSTVTIKTESIDLSVTVDLNAPLRGGKAHRDAGILHVSANSTSTFGLTVSVEPYRVEGKQSNLGAGLCHPGVEHADIIASAAASGPFADTVTWYHYNHLNCTYYNDTVANQGVDPSSHPELADPFLHRSWGASVSAAGLHSKQGSKGLVIASTSPLKNVDVVVKMLTLEPYQAPTEGTWVEEIVKISPAPPSGPSAPESCANDEDQADCR
jgi:hypothetical protein